ncbi:type II toxin-antitoxin system VapC family toxin [Aurantimonas sp. MSK8Z-1]|uniref:type II toxin-antitoxin system VapC family toxin n=1 Tax=Mangrovibrevibacter kandeliae TaxID=2968473 RepID=UPI0021182965|nr:type II toxin-antitoxin system VapC family toxin [Aurantimonas sp. MSK8Z-1]MCW4116932.1 type II toxin-antitoxin system VapC family toxin [Aurantimonas sp. MSK8Z-1]
MATFIDTNVLIDVAVRDPVWRDWSRKQILEAHGVGPLVINQVVFAEFALRYDHLAGVEALLPASEFVRESVPWEAAYGAARAFRLYRRRGGSRQSVLPDFFIGAHAAVRGYRLITRDVSGYRTYFPQLDLIAPETHP